MTAETWTRTLAQFEENLDCLVKMEPALPDSSAKLCRESAHRTLGHLTACQSAWLPLMQQLSEGKPTGSIPINPDPLFRKLGYETEAWEPIFDRFIADRSLWRDLIEQVDVTATIQTTKRLYSAQTLTKRMVDHEKTHLDALT